MLSDSQRAMLAARLRRGREDATTGIPRRAAGCAELPASFGQEQLWFIDRFAPGLPTYNIPSGLRLRGLLDVAALGRALDALVARHEALRTRLVESADGRPVQVVDEPAGRALTVVDLSGLDPVAREARMGELAAAEGARPFVLAQGPLLRVQLVCLSPTEHVLLVVVHHSVFDGWSFGVLLRELAALYEAEVTGQPAGLAPLPVQFADFALWERERLQGAALEELVGYWRTALKGYETLHLPTDRPRPMLESFRGRMEHLKIDVAVLEGLRELSRREGATLFVTLLAAVQVLLHRYSGQDDVVVGTASANRSRAELAPLIGFLVNTLPIRSDLSGDPSFREVLGRVRETTVAAYAHQDLPFAKLAEALRVERDPSRAPVFQVMFTHAETDSIAFPTAAGIEFDIADGYAEPESAKFDLAIFAGTSEREFVVMVQYATALFDDVTVRRLLGNLRVLLEGVVADPSQRLSQLPLLTEEEQYRELVECNDTAAQLASVCLHERFEGQVEQTPDRVAAECGSQSVTYAELNRQANRVARRLHGLGVGPEVLVGVSMAPSLRRLAVLLGILKAGGGYVPLDPELPGERLSFMMSDTAMPVVVADAASVARLPATGTGISTGISTGTGSTAAVVVPVDSEWDAIAELDGADPGYPVQTSNVAYVIYTSGSTGQPKGVMVEHRQATNFALGMVAHFPVTPQDRVLQFASLNFDVSVLDMFVTLLAGARAVVAGRETLLSPPRLAALMRERQVSFACLPPAVVSLLADEQFPDLRVLMSAGEELPAALASRWLRPGLRLVNGYGPTEDTVIATFAELDGSVSPPPIGRPSPNYQAYVLDRHLNPVPVGVVGELHLGGAGVARGYLNSPELSAQRFVSDPFSEDLTARLYKTGDLVRRLPSGDLVFVGRIDGQVKIRGLRVELGEIEAALLRHPAVAQAVVVVGEDRSGGKQLVGYVRADPGGLGLGGQGLVSQGPGGQGLGGQGLGGQGLGVDVADLRQQVAHRLPGYMMPTHLVVVDSFALNANGKIDKALLPAPDSARDTAASYVAPRTLTETMLVDMYAGLLAQERVGIEDSFFDLGGNSLQAMQLVSLVHKDLAVDIGVTAIFLAPTARQLAARIEKARGGTARPAAAGPLVELSDGGGDKPLFVVHAVGGTVYAYVHLAKELADTFTVYGIEAAGLSDGSSPVTSLTTMVASYVEAIRAAQPDGPYRLAGWSMGGVVAFEIARRLEELGQEVAFLAMLDAPFTMADQAVAESQLATLFVGDALRTLGWTAVDAPEPASASTADQLTWLAERLDSGAGNVDTIRTHITRRFDVFTAHHEVIAGYRPQGGLRAETLVVSAKDSPNAAAQPHWAGLLDGTAATLCVDGDHYTFLQPPYVQRTAEMIVKLAAPTGRQSA